MVEKIVAYETGEDLRDNVTDPEGDDIIFLGPDDTTRGGAGTAPVSGRPARDKAVVDHEPRDLRLYLGQVDLILARLAPKLYRPLAFIAIQWAVDHDCLVHPLGGQPHRLVSVLLTWLAVAPQAGGRANVITPGPICTVPTSRASEV